MVWCGVACCGVAWCGVAWFGVAWCDVVFVVWRNVMVMCALACMGFLVVGRRNAALALGVWYTWVI